MKSLSSLVVALILSSVAVAQSPRTNFVFHVYVDPIFGDDETAWELNPGNPPILPSPPGYPGAFDVSLHAFPRWPTGTRPRPLASEFEYLDYNADFPLTGNLQHAPYSFRTLSRQHGALEYIYSLFDTDISLAGPSLPWTNPNNGARVEYVVIHCLPGLYGPRISGDPSVPEIDAVTGLPWNGEEFPIRLGRAQNFYRPHGLYDRVSIQGTSALDTIFDGRGKDHSLHPYLRSSDIFQIWAPPAGSLLGTAAHGNAFIDGITIRNALVSGDYPDKHGIGIHMLGNGGNIGINVTNCMIYNNVAGIVLDAHGVCLGTIGSCTDTWGTHRPIIANNTIVSNELAVWAGELTQDNSPPSGPYAVNNHAPLLINNILLGSESCFEGLSRGCFDVVQVDDQPITPLDFNAFDPTLANNGYVPGLSGWAIANTGFVTTPITPIPRVDLGPFATNPFANYFVGYVLAGAGISNGVDLRLSPYVSDVPANPPGAMNPLIENPLIGAGVSLATPSPNTGLAIMNALGTGFDSHPGLPDSAEEAPLHGWDYDCEGFGNRRLAGRYGITLATPYGSSDIGADQCSLLIMAGHVPGTRMFIGNNPVTGPSAYNRIFFVDKPNQTGLPRPLHNYVVGYLPWFANAESSAAFEPATPYGGASLPKTFYTPGMTGTARWSMYTQAKYGPFQRNLECDFSPYVLSDPKFWGQAFTQIGALDPYGCNPYYHALWDLQNNGGYSFILDNPNLFHNRYTPQPHGQNTWLVYVGARTWVLDGHLNPPATLFNPALQVNYLNGVAGFFGPWSTCGTSQSFATGAWGLNDACPDELPALQLELGIRFNCEIPAVLNPFQSNTNLQTFLVIANGGGSYAAMSSSSTSQAMSLEAILAARRSGLSLAHLLNMPAVLGTEVEFQAYCSAVRAMTGAGR